MIAETSPVQGIEPDGVRAWEDWFAHFFSLTYDKNIRAICFINVDWTQVPIIDWADARLTNNETIAEAWFLEVNQDRYLKQSPTLYEALGYVTAEE